MPRGARKPGPHSSIYSNRLSRKSHFASQRPVSASAKMDKLKILPHRVIEGLYKSLTTGLSVFCTAVSPLFGIWFSSVQSLSRVRLFVTPWTAACQASLSITNSQSLLKLMSIELVMPSNHLILCHPFPLLPSIFPHIRVFSNESILCIRWPKYWSFSFSISPSNEYSGLDLNPALASGTHSKFVDSMNV